MADTSTGGADVVDLQRMLSGTSIVDSTTPLDHHMSSRPPGKNPSSSESLLIHTLPPEILAEIFEHSLPLHVLSDLNLNPRTKFKAADFYKLGSVCHSWRKLAWSVPRLWSSIYIYARHDTVKRKIMMLKDWLGRSGDVPLDIGLSGERNPNWFKKHYTFAPLVDVANKHASRWRTFVFQMPAYYSGALPGPDVPLPLLTNLVIEIPGAGERFYRPSLHGLFGQAHRIQYLKLNYFYPVAKSLCSNNVITSLVVTGDKPKNCLYLLSQCSNIERCEFSCKAVSLSGGTGNFVYPTPERTIFVPSLKTLRVSNISHSDQSHFFNSLALPELTEFSYRGPTLDVQPVCGLVSKSLKLQTCRLHRPSLSGDGLLDIMHAIPSVRSFWYTVPEKRDESGLTDRVLMEMGKLSADGQPIVLPNIEFFKYVGPQGFNWTILINAWCSRKGISLSDSHHLSVTSPSTWKAFDIDILKRLYSIPTTSRKQFKSLFKRLQRDPSHSRGLKIILPADYYQYPTHTYHDTELDSVRCDCGGH